MNFMESSDARSLNRRNFTYIWKNFEILVRIVQKERMEIAREAKALRLCTQTAPDGDSCVRAAMVLAARVAGQAPIAVRSTVFSLRAKQDRDLDLALRRCALTSIFLIISGLGWCAKYSWGLQLAQTLGRFHICR